jgi:hypothetical protein
MSKPQNQTVSRRDRGSWDNKKNSIQRASSVRDTQKYAVKAAKEMLENQGGGELKIKGMNGKIRSKDMICSGNGPNPPKDREH